MSRTRRPLALVTGASSGIGEALARRFAQGGHDLVMVARSAERLQALAAELSAAHGVKAWAQPADLSLPEAPAELAASLRQARRPVAVLVNCAGVLHHGAFVDMPREDDNFFVAQKGVGKVPGGLKLRVTASTGQVVTDTLPRVEDNKVVAGGAQF